MGPGFEPLRAYRKPRGREGWTFTSSSFFCFPALADSGRGLAERAVALSWHLPVDSFRWGDKIGGAEVALSWRLPVGFFRWGDEAGGAEMALGMALPDELQQES